MAARKFDLNIEKILEDWEVHHAVREVIANALDEQLLSDSKDIGIFKDKTGRWHVRDHGRGLRYEHLTQKENDEKLDNPSVIGKFGIGLKDALATFDRKKVGVLVKSRFGDITLGKSEKHGFEDIVTLHAYVSEASNPKFVGTEVVLDGASDQDIARAKDLFLRFSGEAVIEETKYGQVLERKGKVGRIYINGVRAAEEENFLLSYNITSLTHAIRKALNRERSNVGRTAYADRVKSMLTSCKGKEVATLLVQDLQNFESGEMHDELKWLDVQEHAVKILNAQKRVVFLTPNELISETMMVDEAKRQGLEIVTVPENLRDRIRGATDISGMVIRDLGQFNLEYIQSFEFKFIDPQRLTARERRVFDATSAIFMLIDGRPKNVKEVKISETMRRELGSGVETDGVWEAASKTIIIKRSVLRSLESYAGTLLHEVAHATSGAGDVTREFELELTRLTGVSASKSLGR